VIKYYLYNKNMVKEDMDSGVRELPVILKRTISA
jgi:hypothetical protein